MLTDAVSVGVGHASVIEKLVCCADVLDEAAVVGGGDVGRGADDEVTGGLAGRTRKAAQR